MKNILIPIVIVMAVLFTACQAKNKADKGNNDMPESSGVYYFDSRTGNDTNSGTNCFRITE